MQSSNAAKSNWDETGTTLSVGVVNVTKKVLGENAETHT